MRPARQRHCATPRGPRRGVQGRRRNGDQPSIPALTPVPQELIATIEARLRTTDMSWQVRKAASVAWSPGAAFPPVDQNSAGDLAGAVRPAVMVQVVREPVLRPAAAMLAG
jgi:hypothetical protein